MKTSLLIIALTTFTAGAANAADIVACYAPCLVIDHAGGKAYQIGTAKGSSEMNQQEAFELMERDCQKRALAIAGPNIPAVLVQYYESTSSVRGSQEQHNSQTSSVSRGVEIPFIMRQPSGSNRKSTATGSSSSFQNDFGLKVRPAGFESCQPIQSNPNGRPKYQGDLPLLG